MVVVNLLKGWKFKVDIADNGKIVIDKLRTKPYNIILMDLQMPEMDGYETTKYIRNKMESPINKIPIIALTASVLFEEQDKILLAGMDDYVTKPFDPNDLYIKILTLVGKNNSFLNITTELVKDEGGRIKDEVRNVKDEDVNKSDLRYVDLSYLKGFSNGDNEFVVVTVRAFLNQMPVYIDKIKKLYEEKKWDELKFTAHRVKSSVGLLGIKELEKITKSIEEYTGDKINIESVPDLIVRMDTIFQKAFKEIETEIKNLS
jgi:CheY-like chemotaxis protein